MTRRLRTDQRGMTLIELMVAALVLVVGILGVITLVDRANVTLGESNARVGATNLARELVEHTRSLDYDVVTTGRLPAPLRAKTGVPGSANGWTVTRRGVDYTVAVKVCLYDDPQDGLASAAFTTGDADRPLCTPRASAIAGNTRVDANPDDFRRLQVDLDWGERGKDFHARQDALLVNPTGALGARITKFPDPALQIATPVSPLLLTGIESTPAKTVHWNAGTSSGDALAVGVLGTNWTISWAIGTQADASYVFDGRYQVEAQAFSDLGVPGDVRVATVYLNRYLPGAPPADLIAGRNTSRTPGIVELRWSPNPERDVIGYRVYRVEPNATRTRICPGAAGDAVLIDTSCIDAAPPATAVTYEVVAVDYTDLKNQLLPRQGAVRAVAVPVLNAAAVLPSTPTGLAVTTVDGRPKLTWTQPGGVTGLAFFRIYRDGSAVADRYATTVTADPFWVDPDPGNGGHVYRVSAVNTTLNESLLSSGVSWP
jgi:prepilin-type N-terminal cleavage/methylation domain-containing protein